MTAPTSPTSPLVAARPTVSVVVCAYTDERWHDLVAAVDSVRGQTLPARETIVVIDHNPGLLQRARAVLEDVVVVASEGPQGLSGARNTGVARAGGDIVAFLDDDATAEPGWLAALADAYADPDVIGAGGAIVPAWDSDRPAWFPEEFQWVVGCTYRGLPESAGPVRNLIGANMSFRRSVFDEGLAFATGLGRVGGTLLHCEDTELCIRIGQRWPGRTILHVPAARVRHRVPDARTRWAYFRERCYTEGLSKARLARIRGRADGLAAERAYALRILPSGVVAGVRETAATRRPDGLRRAAAIVAGLGLTTAGYAVGSVLGRGRAAGRGRVAAAAPPEPGDAAPAPGRPLRVLMVCVKYLPSTGGTELHVHEVSRRLAALGHEVAVLTVAHDPALLGDRVEDGVRVIRVRAHGGRVDAYLAPAMWRIVRDPRWDVVHCQGFHTLVAPLALAASLAGGRHRPVVTFHRGGHSSPLRRRLTALQSRALRPLLRRADRLVAVSRFEASLFSRELGLPLDRFLVIPNGTRLSRDPSLALPPPSPDLLVSVGRLEAYKGHQRIVAAMPEILRARPGTRLRVAGTGPYEGELRALVARLGLEDRVTIAAVPPSDPAGMARLLAEAALVLTLSDYESQPLAVLEALALGRPTLVQDCGGNTEFVEDGLVRAVPPGAGPDVVARAVLELLDEGWAPPAVTLPDWDDCTARTLELYASVVGAVAGSGRS